MRASGTFSVKSFVPTSVAPDPPIVTALPVGVWQMEKHYEGDITGRSATLFTAAFDQAKSTGSYVAMESFEGIVNGQSGSFNFVHSASTQGSDRSHQFFVIVASSGTAGLAGISGGGGMDIEADGTHRIWLDYDLSQSDLPQSDLPQLDLP
jgi:Protein of unknown function (DUF3224)